MTWKDEIKKEDDLSSRFKTSRADFMKELPTAYKSLQKAILHLEIIGHDIMSEVIDGHRPMSSLDLDSYEVIEVLKEFTSALIKMKVEAEIED